MPGLSPDERRRERERAAHRHYGRKYAWFIVFGPWVAKLALWAVLIGAAWLTWAHVSHVLLGSLALTVAAVAGLAWARPVLGQLSVRRRVAARAAQAGPRLQIGWAYASLMLVGLGMGWLALWSPFS